MFKLNENNKKNIDFKKIENILDLKYFVNNYQSIDLEILKSYNSLVIVNFFEKKIPRDIKYLKRILNELKLIQNYNSIEIFLTLKTIINYFKNSNIIINTTLNTLLISYLMGLTNNDPINFQVNLSEFKEKAFIIEINLSELNKNIVKDLNNNLINTENVLIKINHNKKIDTDPSILDSRNSSFRKIKIKKKSEIDNKNLKIKKSFYINLLINHNSLIYIYNNLPTCKKINKYVGNHLDLIGIPIIENRVNLIYCKYKKIINDHNDINDILNLSAITDISFLFKKNNIFNEKYNAISCDFDKSIDFIKNLCNCNVDRANLYYKSFLNNKNYMRDLFIEDLKKNGIKIKEIKLILNKLENFKIIENNRNIEYISKSKFIFEILESKINNPNQYYLLLLNNLDKLNFYYRKWVYFRNCINSGLKITLGYSNWNLVDNQIKNYYEYHDYNNDSLNFKKYGFWNSHYFLENMYLNVCDNFANFRGLIASQEKKKIKNKIYSWVVIGYENNTFIDIFIEGDHQFDKMECLEGSGLIMGKKDFNWILANNFKNSFL